MPWARQSAKSLLFGFLAFASAAAAAPPENTALPLPALQSISVEPRQIDLHGSNRQQQLLITGLSAAGQPIDVTHLCEVVSSDPSVLAVAGSRVQGVRDGAAEIRIGLGKWSHTVPAAVRDFTM